VDDRPVAEAQPSFAIAGLKRGNPAQGGTATARENMADGTERRASRTAEFMALFRALESCRPPGLRLFEDRFAIGFLRRALRFVVDLSRLPRVGGAVSRFIDYRWPGARSSGVARTRLIDDLLASELQRGVSQVVILGAGFDCRAYRIAAIERTRVFEVDHPATLASKQRHLAHLFGSLPPHVTFVACDFNRQRLSDVMEASGLEADERTFFIWEGVTNYLMDDAVDATLRYVSAVAARGSRIVFTYVHRGLLDGTVRFEGTEKLFRTLKEVGEPWTFGLDPAEVAAYLGTRGFHLLLDLGASDYRRRYMKDRHGMNGYEFYRVALAETLAGATARVASAKSQV
jgi:methyltransferase (TIGR00027 family)